VGPLITDCHLDLGFGRALPDAVRHPPATGAAYPDWMKRAWPVTQAAVSLAAWPLTVILSLVILVAGEPVNRYVMRQMRRITAGERPAGIQHADQPAPAAAVLPPRASLLLAVISNPLWIALTAPGRWVSDRFRRPPSTGAASEAR
jgi:hypothetical protein